MELESLQSSIKSQGTDDYFAQKRMEMMLETSNKKVINELSAIHSAINKLNDDVSEIKRMLVSIQLKPSPPVYSAPPPVSIISEASVEQPVNVPHVQAAPQINSQKPRDSEPLRPRYGDYTSADVSVDKFFYFGNKTKR